MQNTTNTSPWEILLIEDHPATAKAMSRLLAYYGYRVHIAGGVHEALELCNERGDSLDLVISDLELPDGCGCELMKHLKQQFDVPAIALTGHAFPHDVARTREAGFNAHLSKPVTMDALREAVRHWCEAGRAVRIPPTPMRMNAA